jgi:Na+/proline symporter/signal transduction histidine kinase
MTPGMLAAISAIYVASLFGVAWLGDKATARGARFFDRPAVSGVIYCLTLAVYNTSWSFYGSVGRAARTGWGYLPIYLAPVLILTVGRPLLRRIVAAADRQGATSIADFLAARYGARQSVAALVTIGSLAAVLPYIALQLKAVAGSFERLQAGSRGVYGAPASIGVIQDTAFWVTVAMAMFIVMFGVRHSHRSERHRGLMIAVAFDSIVKLVAFLAVATEIISEVFGPGLSGVARAFASLPPALVVPDVLQPLWLSNTLIAALSFLCLPHMFHVMAVERNRTGDLAWGGRLFPLYLVLLSLLMLPVAAAGITVLGSSAQGDGFMIALPLAAGRPSVAVLAYIGGLSAATGMVIVATVALATMLCNDVIMPVVLQAGRTDARLRDADVSALLITVRRIAVGAILLLAYAMHRATADYRLTETGLVSFVGVAQFGPALIAGLYWRRANAAGAVAGIAVGLAIWAWLLLGPISFRPVIGSDPISITTLASLAANIALFWLVSITATQEPGTKSVADSAEPLSGAELRALAVRFVGTDAANTAFARVSSARFEESPHTLAELTRNLLAGAIGSSSARVVMAAAGDRAALGNADARTILDQASEALRINHRLLRTVLDTIPQGICIFDAEQRIVAWNITFLRLLDIPSGIVCVGLPLADLLIFNLSRARYVGSDPRLLLAPNAFEAEQWPYVYERERPDGTVIEIAFDRLPDGGLVSTYSDVTERHRTAAALRVTNDELEVRVRERTEALARATAAAEAANLAKTRFLAAAGHDLLQPINAARLFLATVEHQAKLGKAAVAAVASAATAIHSTEAMIHGLSELSALDTGGMQAAITSIDLPSLLGSLASEMNVIAGEANVVLDVSVHPATVCGDPALLRRIVQNYLVNALRHAGAKRVLLRSRARGPCVEIQVWDDGCGIPRSMRTAIFDEFHRGGRPSGAGMGLGLAIVRRIGAMLGHTTGVFSRLNRGSCFYVRVPVSARNGIAVPEHAVSRGELRALRVLCVDDNSQVLAALSGLLTQWGQVVEIQPGAVPPQAMVLDYHLEDGLTGVDLFDRLSALWGRQVPTLLATADRSTEVREQAAARGIGIVHKPIHPDALRAFLVKAAT